MATDVSRSAMAPSSWSVRPWFFCRAFILPPPQEEKKKHYAETASLFPPVLTFAPLFSAASAFLCSLGCSLALTGNLVHMRKQSQTDQRGLGAAEADVFPLLLSPPRSCHFTALWPSGGEITAAPLQFPHSSMSQPGRSSPGPHA